MQNNWYNIVRDYTIRLVGIHSVNSTAGELRVAEEVLRLLQSDGLESAADSSDASEVEQADRDVPAGAERRREQLERAVLSGREP